MWTNSVSSFKCRRVHRISPNQSTRALWIWRKCSTRGVLWGVLREYGVQSPLLRISHSLYERSMSLVCIASSKSDMFPVHVCLHQGCPLSPTFMDRISRCSQAPERVWFGDHRISSLLFTDDDVLFRTFKMHRGSFVSPTETKMVLNR